MLGDSILDLGLDTLPMTLRMTGEYLEQQKNGVAPGEEELSIGDILKEAGVNIATNAGFNTLGELAPATLRALSSRFHGRPVMSAAQDAALEKAIHGAELAPHKSVVGVEPGARRCAVELYEILRARQSE